MSHGALILPYENGPKVCAFVCAGQGIIPSLDAHTSPQDHLNGSQSVSNPTLGQLVRFVVVGTSLNLMLYACYLAMVSAQFGSKLAMSVVYGAGVAFGFVLNRRWSFGRGDAVRNAGLRYVAVCVGGYFLNLCALLLFVDAMVSRTRLFRP